MIINQNTIRLQSLAHANKDGSRQALSGVKFDVEKQKAYVTNGNCAAWIKLDPSELPDTSSIIKFNKPKLAKSVLYNAEAYDKLND